MYSIRHVPMLSLFQHSAIPALYIFFVSSHCCSFKLISEFILNAKKKKKSVKNKWVPMPSAKKKANIHHNFCHIYTCTASHSCAEAPQNKHSFLKPTSFFWKLLCNNQTTATHPCGDYMIW